MTHRLGPNTTLVKGPDTASVDRERKFTFINEKYDINLIEIVEKFISSLELDEVFNIRRMDFQSVVSKSAGKTRRKPTAKDFLVAQKAIPSTLCNKCVYNTTCPFYVRSRVCFYLSTVFNMPRRVHEFLPALKDQMTLFAQTSTLFKVEQTELDLMFFVFLGYVFNRVHVDSNSPNLSPKYRGNKENKENRVTPYGRLGISNTLPIVNKVKEEQERIEQRWKILGMKGNKRVEYYPQY